jgi:hypothetical protein
VGEREGGAEVERKKAGMGTESERDGGKDEKQKYGSTTLTPLVDHTP